MLLHPNIELVNDMAIADMIVYLPVSMDWGKTECNNPQYFSKTIVLDEGDYPELFTPGGGINDVAKWLLYFKRSYVRRQDGRFIDYMNYLKRNDVLPMTYTIAEAYVKNTFNMIDKRDFEIVCTLRGSKDHDPTRLRIREWIQEYVQARGIKKYVAGQLNADSRTVVSVGYFAQMNR